MLEVEFGKRVGKRVSLDGFPVGILDEDDEGWTELIILGCKDGSLEGNDVGLIDDAMVGVNEGYPVGVDDGVPLGCSVGFIEGIDDGFRDGVEDGKRLGFIDGTEDGSRVGNIDGISEGRFDGFGVGDTFNMDTFPHENSVRFYEICIKRNFTIQTHCKSSPMLNKNCYHMKRFVRSHNYLLRKSPRVSILVSH